VQPDKPALAGKAMGNGMLRKSRMAKVKAPPICAVLKL
jgi:hypothetical protein